MAKSKEFIAPPIDVCIGIDQGYPMYGLAVAIKGVLIEVKTIDVHKLKISKAERRRLFRRELKAMIDKYDTNDGKFAVVIERVRMFSQTNTISMATITALAGLVIAAGDVCHRCGVPLYSVDTRSWKAQSVGSAKATKEDTIRWVAHLGFPDQIEHGADAAGMALYPWTAKKPALKVED